SAIAVLNSYLGLRLNRVNLFDNLFERALVPTATAVEQHQQRSKDWTKLVNSARSHGRILSAATRFRKRHEDVCATPASLREAAAGRALQSFAKRGLLVRPRVCDRMCDIGLLR